MAVHLVQEDGGLEIYGPVIMNAEVLASKGEPEAVRHVGMGQQRNHLRELIRETYPLVDTVSELSPRVLPYSLAEGQIDGAIVDVTKAALLQNCRFSPVSRHDYISYVLVVQKHLTGRKPFVDFLEAYRKAVDGLQDPEALDKAFGVSSQVKFLYLE